MKLAEELARQHDLMVRGTDYVDERAVDAINEALERAAQVCDAQELAEGDSRAVRAAWRCGHFIRDLKS